VSHYEQRVQADLDRIRDRVRAVGEAVHQNVENACHALLELDRRRAAETIIADMPVNRAIRDIDRLCHAFVVRHVPSAGILRFISSVLRLTIAVERVGDYAATIAREVVQLSAPPPPAVARDVEMVGEQTRLMFRQSMKAFIDGNAELARGIKGMARQMDSTFERVFDDLLVEGEQASRPLLDLFALLVVFNRLERIGDQAKNLCEETIFAVTGETKEPKRYMILFADARNDCWSQMAAAAARKAFPESGTYTSAGWDPADQVRPALVQLLDAKGVDTSGLAPAPLPKSRDALDDFHLVVGLEGSLRDHLAVLPFRTVLLDWNLPEAEADATSPEALEAAWRQISVRVRGLMEQLRGEDAT
jgi:phosphate transport system protein